MMSKRSRRVGQGERVAGDSPDMVDEASMESFPASDAPPWTGGIEDRSSVPTDRNNADAEPR